MGTSLSIQEFHALLTSGGRTMSTSEKKDDLLLRALRDLTDIEKPEDVAAVVQPDAIVWSNWG